MKLENNNQTFAKAIFEYLLTMCENGESVVIDRSNINNILFTTKTGITKLGIVKNAFLKPLYLDNPSDLLAYLAIADNSRKPLVLIVNLEKRDFRNIKLKFDKNISILYAPKLEIDEAKYRTREYVPAIDVTYKQKSLNIERFDKFLYYVIRLKITAKLFVEFDFDPSKIIAKPGQNSVLPFTVSIGEKKYLIYEEKAQIDKTYYKRYVLSESPSLIKLSIKSSLNAIEISSLIKTNVYRAQFEQFKSFNLHKVTANELIERIDGFNSIYGIFCPNEFVQLYKYRAFEKTRYTYDKETITFTDPTLFKHKESEEIQIGIRSAIEQGTIWFSSYESLNDPFDLLGRIPERKSLKMESYYSTILNATDYKVTNTNFLTFCSTSREDNILMWSHYADSHKGTCIRYPMLEIIKAIEKDPRCGFCVYGRIKYSKNRPTFRFPFTYFRFLDFELAILRFNIISMFNKFYDWQYEHEFRFIILPIVGDNPDSYKKGLGIHLMGNDLYVGCNFDDKKYGKYIASYFKTFKKMSMSKTEYKLI